MIKYRLRGKNVEQLVDLAQSGLRDALEMIIEKYYPMVLKISSKYYAPWAEKDDIVQNGLVGLIKAVFYYNKEKSGFTSFAWRSIEAEIQSFLTYLNRKKNKILSEAVSVDAFTEDGEGESSYFMSDYKLTTSRKAIVEYLIEEVMKFLSEEEKEIFSMWLNGYS
ncbi:MAG: RNA polymerase subunit sigma-70, partial [Thermotoga sp.]